VAVAAALVAGTLLPSGGMSRSRPSPASPPAWQAPTPGPSAQLAAGALQPFTVRLRAGAPDAQAVVRIDVQSLPDGARVRMQPGNPAVASLTWTPTVRQSGRFALELVATRVDAIAATALRTIVVVVAPPPPVSLVGPGGVSHWAYVLQSTPARAGPSTTARVVASIAELTSERLPNLLSLVREVYDTSGNAWVLARLAVLPNGTVGWVPRAALGSFHRSTTQVVVDRARLRLTLTRSGRVLLTAPIGVGEPRWPTPPGAFYVREVLRNFDSPFYGPVAFGTSARSAVLTDWPGGGFIGIHGTSLPQLIPGRISHGCIRLRNDDIVRLDRLMTVGTPVTIR